MLATSIYDFMTYLDALCDAREGRETRPPDHRDLSALEALMQRYPDKPKV